MNLNKITLNRTALKRFEFDESIVSDKISKLLHFLFRSNDFLQDNLHLKQITFSESLEGVSILDLDFVDISITDRRILFQAAELRLCVFGVSKPTFFLYNFKVYRNHVTFRQTNIITSNDLYSTLGTCLPKPGRRLTCIGGECYLFPKLYFKLFSSFQVMSDYEEIIEVAQRNLKVEREIKPVEFSVISYQQPFNETDFPFAGPLIINVRSLTSFHLDLITSRTGTDRPGTILINCNPNNIKKLRQRKIKFTSIQISSNVELLII